ncbi:MAG: T9SS type A sorting domain-containing protein, partial [Candidatus Hydrothermia bacterium]
QGVTWDTLGTGMCGAEIYDMDFDYQHQALFVATHGRGMWKLPDYQVRVSDGGDDIARFGLFWAPGAGILYCLPEGKHRLSIYDASGRLVASTVLSGGKGTWKTSELAPGVYVARTGSWSAVFPIAK